MQEPASVTPWVCKPSPFSDQPASNANPASDMNSVTRISLLIPCFNGGREALATTLAFETLQRPANVELEAIIVDDASTDGSTHDLGKQLPEWARLVRTPSNLGRGGAVNLGAASACGEFLLILDCDCMPLDPDFLQRHLDEITEGADASVGNIVGHDEGFWGKYQSAAATRRAAAARSDGAIHAMTTANIMLRTDAFRSIGGFDERFRHYGFEDRDFLLRLEQAGARLVYNPTARVRHAANMDMASISRKMRACGCYSAPIFRKTHPRAYSALGYAAIDASLHPWRGTILAPLSRAVVSHAEMIERLLQHKTVPFGIRASLARIVTALSYLEGTRASRNP